VSGPAPRSGWGPALLTAVVLAPLLALTLFRAHAGDNPSDDQGLFTYFGWRIAHGAVVYRDVWDNKPPGIYWLNALGWRLGGDHYAGVVALHGVALALTAAALYAAARRLYGPPAAALTTLVAALYLWHPQYVGGANRTETYVALFETLAFAAYLRGLHRGHTRWWLAVGLLCGAAFLCKQIGLAAALALGAHTVMLGVLGYAPLAQTARRAAALAGGALAVVGAAVAVLAWQGAAGEAWGAVVAFNRAYFAAGGSGFGVTLPLIAQHIRAWMLPLVVLAALGLLRLIRQHTRAPTESTDPPGLWLLLVAWAAAALWGAVVSPAFVPYYVPPTVPPLALLAGSACAWVCGPAQLTHRLRRSALASAALLAIIGAATPAVRDSTRAAGDVWRSRAPRWAAGQWWPTLRPTRCAETAAVIRTLAGPDEPIQGFGYLPSIYLHARRANAVRFATSEKLGQVGQYADWMRAELWQRLQADPPRVLFVPGDSLDFLDPSTAPDDPRSPAAWLARHYAPGPPRPELALYVRRTLP
jgi:4-amino-4-deoxy-L-arabinose transferase-like glycosyltransferase